MGQTDEELARAAVWPLFGDRATDAELRRRIATACATARALGRADALAGRGEITTLTIQERRIVWRSLMMEAAEIERDPSQATSRAQTYRDLAQRFFPAGSNEARGEASTAEGPTTAASRPKPASEASEAVASALWRAWWRTHGEHEPSFHFSQLYESARQRWVDIAAAGIAAWEDDK